MNHSPWQCLEEIPGGFAAPAVWRHHLGENFEPFRGAFLQPEAAPALALEDKAKGANAGSSTTPKELSLRINWTKLGNTLRAAFDLDRKVIDLPLPDTYQIGSWSVDAVPVVLTVQKERQAFHHVICELGLRLHRPFILLGPTSVHMDVSSHELLAHARAGFFALDSHTFLTDHGSLRLRKAAGELFAQFTPAPRQTADEDTTQSLRPGEGPGQQEIKEAAQSRDRLQFLLHRRLVRFGYCQEMPLLQGYDSESARLHPQINRG